MAISFDRLVSRSVARFISEELDLSGVKMTVSRFIGIAIIGGLGIFVATPIIAISLLKMNAAIAALAGIIMATVYEFVLYSVLEFKADQRKSFVEGILPDYLQIVSANITSGVALDKALILAARPEFKFFSDDVKLVSMQLYGGETIKNALEQLGNRYRSQQLKRTIRMISEAIQYGGAMTDLLNNIAKDLRNSQIIQKEISGQLFMYSIFIAFAAVIGAPALYALTSRMITITDTVWAGIIKQNPNGLPSVGISLIKFSAPQVTISDYHSFALAAIIIITGFCAFIVSTIANGTPKRGIKYLPVFIAAGFVVFFLVGVVMQSVGGSTGV